jgi:hypothetical protein
MATQVQWRGGSTAEHSTFTGAAREITVDTQKKTLVVHDGSTAGGEPLLREDQANLPTSVTNGIAVPSANNVALSTNGTGRLFVTSDGKVGLGTSAPSEQLHVNGNAIVEDRLLLQRLQSSDNLSVLTFSDTLTGSKGNNLSIGNPGGYDVLLHTGGVEKVRLTSDGKLGLGTSTPATKLNVWESTGANLFRLNGLSSYNLNIANNYDSGTRYDFSVGSSAGAFSFSTSAGERARIDSSGRLLVGTSSQPNTGGTLCVNNGIGIVNNTTSRFATVEHGNGASGTFTTITISATVPSGDASVIFETLMTGFSGVYLDNVSAQYSNQAAVTMRSNASAGTSAALTVNGTNTIYTLTITTNVTHPVVKVKVTAGGIVGNITLPTITFA